MRYDAFISYRHSELDSFVAKNLHRSLETFKVPRAVAKQSGKKSIKRVFRDQEELPIGSDLTNNIEAALKESEYLIVICSPRTPGSEWVAKEIDTFIKLHGRNKVLAVLIEGEPDESFPPQLLTDEEGNSVEPLAADVRGDNQKEVKKKLKSEVVRLCAPLLGCTYDDLKQRHRERRLKTIALAASVVASLAVAFGIYSVYTANQIRQNYNEKLINQSKYLADTSLSVLETGDRKIAAAIALEALPTDKQDRPYVAKAQYALTQALDCYRNQDSLSKDGVLLHDLNVQYLQVDSEAENLVTIDAAKNLYWWKLKTNTLLTEIAPKYDDSAIAVDILGATVYKDTLVAVTRNAITAYNSNGKLEWQTDFEEAMIYCEFNSSGSMVAVDNNDEVIIFDCASGEKLYRLENTTTKSFCAEIVFSWDDSILAISHLNEWENTDPSTITLWEFTQDVSRQINARGDFISDLSFTKDGGLAVDSSANFYEGQPSDKIVTHYIESIDLQSGASRWCLELTCDKYSILHYYPTIKCRDDEVVYCLENKLYGFNSSTGELINQFRLTSGVVDFFLSLADETVYIADNSGKLTFADMSTGEVNDDITYDIRNYLSRITIKKGTLIAAGLDSPEVTVVKNIADDTRENIAQYDDRTHSFYVSPEEECYAEATEGGLYFYNASDDEKISHIELRDQSLRINNAGFVDENTFAIIWSDGVIQFVDVKSGDMEDYELGEAFEISYSCANQDMSYALVYKNQKYVVLDLKNKKVGEIEEWTQAINSVAISDDGSKVCFKYNDKNLMLIDLNTMEEKALDEDLIRLVYSLNNEIRFVFSHDGKYLAVACYDGVLRVVDTDSLEIISEIPFFSGNQCFFAFTSDNNDIIMHGNDYYIRVFDIAKNDFDYVSDEQFNVINSVHEDAANNTIALNNSVALILVDSNTYYPTAYIDKGAGFIPKYNKVYAASNKELFSYKYRKLDELIQEAKDKFGDYEFSKQQKARYNID